MATQTFVFFKVTSTDTEIQINLGPLLTEGEIIQQINSQPVQPLTNPPLSLAFLTINQVLTYALLKGGAEGSSYGIPVVIVTSYRSFQILLAVTCAAEAQIPYATANPEAYSDLVDQVEAGSAALGTAIFPFTPDVDPSGGYVTWEFLNVDGMVYASGNAFDYTIKNNGLSSIVTATSVINVPTSVPASLDNQKYQLRYTLTLPNAGPGVQSKFYSYENVTVVGLNTVPLGTQPSVELVGDPITLSLVTDRMYDNVGVELYMGNQLIYPWTPVTNFERVSNGYYWSGAFDSSGLAATLIPYNVVWKYWNNANPGYVIREAAALFLINPSIMMAIQDVKNKVNKARTTLYGTPDLLYPQATILAWLRRGMDAFNGAYGTFTYFDMTNALGPVREYWLLCTEVATLQSQYLAEGEKAFNFQGAAIQLEIDRTSYLDAAMSRIQGQLDAELKPIKQNLVIKGNIAGDGSADPSKLQKGAIASVGITITPASQWSIFGPGYFRGIQ